MSPVKEAAVVPGSWDEIQEEEFKGEYPTLDNGTYPFVLVSADKREGQESGNEYINVRLLHVDDSDPSAEKPAKYSVFDKWHFTSKTVGNSKRIMRIVGVDLSVLKGQEFEEGVVPDALMEAVEDAIEGAPFQVRVKRSRRKDSTGDVTMENAVVRYVG